MPYSDYKHIKYIGKGGYGEVYKVRHNETNEYFALKTVMNDNFVNLLTFDCNHFRIIIQYVQNFFLQFIKMLLMI